jgi:hypothetical protein
MVVASAISSGFTGRSLDLSKRVNAAPVGWDGLPESFLASELRRRGESDAFVRLAITFLAAMDRARDADKLWRRGLALHKSARWTFDLAEVVARQLSELADALLSAGVSQRHLPDSAAWRRIAEALRDSDPEHPVTTLIETGTGSAPLLFDDLHSRTTSGSPRFPLLGGPKIAPMWIRMMVFPGNASVSQLEVVPVAVDVQVCRVTEFLGVADTRGLALEDARPKITRAWRDQATAGEVIAPG